MNKAEISNELCRILRTYIEEFGSVNVEVLLPAAWYQYSDKSGYLSTVKARFVTQDTIEVISKGEFEGASYGQKYSLD